MKRKVDDFRFSIFFIFIVLLAAVILVRFFSLQVTRHGFYKNLARDQHEVLAKLIPQRGEIFIQEKNNTQNPVALNRTYETVYLVPREVKNVQEVVEKLSSLLEIAPETILGKLKNLDDPYEPLKSKISDETAAQIEMMNLPGVHLSPENWRWYPQGNLAANAIGFVGIKEDSRIGQYGVEQYYEKELVGQSGFLQSEKDALGRWLFLGDYNLAQARDGDDLYLTLDQNIQFIVEQKMKALIEKWGAVGGCAIILDPKTGAIRAMASFPNFDPNEYQKVKNNSYFMNDCTQKIYEPGSVFKPIVMAAGLDSGKISPDTTYTDTGAVQIGSYTIRNAQNKTYGLSTMTNVLENSINTGVVFVQRLVGGDVFKEYVEAFGFGVPSGIDLAGEASGSLSNLKENREINFANAAFGQGVATTPLQMAAAIAAIANEGKLMRPYIVEKIISPEGEEKKTEPQIVRQAVSTKTANKLTAMLVSTVRNGYDKVKIKGYFIAGKTGTAQIASGDTRGYLPDETIHSFVGYGPAYNPKFLIFLKLDRPHGINFASESLAPVFSELAQYLFNYYEISPVE